MILKLRHVDIFLLCAFALLPNLSFCQQEKNSGDNGTDEYIEQFSGQVNLKFDIDSDIERYVVKSSDNEFDIRPNLTVQNRISVNYRFLTIGLGFASDFLPWNKPDTLKGKTEAFGVGLKFSYKKWVQSFSYSVVNGFYLDNTADFVNGWVKGIDPYVQFPQLQANIFRGYTLYRFNPKFSLNALSIQTERQLKSAGSFLIQLSYSNFIMDNKVKLTGSNSSQRSDNFEVVAAFGYYYTYVLNQRFYVSAGLSPSVGYNFTKLLTRLPTGEVTSRFSDPIFKISGRGALGYTTNRFFIGGDITFSHASHSNNDTSNEIVTAQTTYQIFVGYRFSPPRFLVKSLDKAENVFRK